MEYLPARDAERVSVGNADDLVKSGSSKWLVGSFIDDVDSLRRSHGVEVKWGRHEKGEARRRASACPSSTSLAILVSGSFAFHFPGCPEDVVLGTEGDYVLYGPGVRHTWEALSDSLILTIRWPAGP